MIQQLGAAAILVPLLIWAIFQFEVRTPPPPPNGDRPGWKQHIASFPLPAYSYIHSVALGSWHSSQGHPAYLWGQYGGSGWWYYFPAVSLYKIPLGIGFLFLLAAGFSIFHKPSWQEWSLIIPALCWLGLLLHTHINIGFRHFLPCYIFLLPLACRVFSARSRPLRLAAWIGIVATAAHSLYFFPNYISYINFPRTAPYLAISDSNVDWGQSLKQTQTWLQANAAGRQVHLYYFADRAYPNLYLNPPVDFITDDARPNSGLLILSPIYLTGQYEAAGDSLGELRAFPPDAIIGQAVLVYDLDKLAREHGFAWHRRSMGGTTQTLFGWVSATHPWGGATAP